MKNKYVLASSLLLSNYVAKTQNQTESQKPAEDPEFKTTEVELLYNQYIQDGNNSAITGGIGTEVTLTPLGVTGFSTNGMVGSATTVVLSNTAKDLDVVTFGIHYNGGGTGTAGNYRTIVTKSGDFRFGDIGF